MVRLIERIAEILRTGEIEYAELQGAVMALAWGIGLMCIQAPALEVPPAYLGISLVAVAVVQLLGIRGLHYGLRRFGAMFAIVLWTFVAGEAADAGNTWRYVICPTCLCLAISSAWGYYRIGRRHEAHIRGLITKVT